MPADAPSGVGDELFPDLGNPGIDVDHYDVDLSYDPDSEVIDATVTLAINATSPLHAFTLDQVGLDVAAVAIDGADAEFSADDPELRITPAAPITAGETFEVTIAYSAEGASGDSIAGVRSGWFPTDLGSFVLNEPDGARNWLPSNDHPSDKATYRFAIHLPDGYTGVANGDLVSSNLSADGDGRVWIWDQSEPMTTYLIQVLTGPYSIIETTSAAGLALTHAVLTEDRELMQPYFDVTPEQIDFFDDFFGPYPFESYGIAMTDANFGGAMEHQGRSLFSRDDFSTGELGYVEQLLLAHELAHQWFGNAVSPARWQDIWLNESFASYAEWMWLEQTEFIDLAETAQFHLGLRQDGSVATGDPTRDGLFSYEVYEGGAVVLQALRLTIGDEPFFRILRRWVADNVDSSRSSADFIALAESVSGQELGQFFDDWLYATDLPDDYPS